MGSQRGLVGRKSGVQACLAVAVGIALAFAATADAQQRTRRQYERQTLSGNTSYQILTDDATHAQVTIAAGSGTPDGTVTIATKPSADGAAVTVATYSAPFTAKTFTGEPQAILVVTRSGATTGTVTVEVTTW